MPHLRQARFGRRRSTGSHVKNAARSPGSRTPRTSRPADGVPTGRESRQAIRSTAGVGSTDSGLPDPGSMKAPAGAARAQASANVTATVLTRVSWVRWTSEMGSRTDSARRVVVVVVAAAWLTAALLLAFPPSASADEYHKAIGRSEQLRVIRVHRFGDFSSPRKILVFGCIHGNECEGIEITRRLARGPIPADIDLWIVHDLNPDGHRLGVRQNGRGVDLNRNFASEWTRRGQRWDPEYSGPRPWSERETRIARQLILRVRPDVTIWYHQPQNLVRAWGQSRPRARRYAQLAGERYGSIRWPRGTAPNWQNHTFPGTASFVVELPPGELADARAARHARAVRRLLGP